MATTHDDMSIVLTPLFKQVGLLPADNLQQVPFAYKMYTDTSSTGWDQSNLFKRTFSIDVDIEFIGVWYVSSSRLILLFATRLIIEQ
jgi:Uncharacterized alpha/beta hydrolase domain (DUF2235)